MSRMDEYLPAYDFVTSHKILIQCAPEEAYETLQTLNFSDSALIRCLFLLRGLKPEHFQDLYKRFSLLYNEPNKEIILGLIAQPWKLSGGILPLSKEVFQNFKEPDYAKIVWGFTFEPLNENETLVSTETRIHCTSIESKKKFKLYWLFIRPFSGLVRNEILKLLRKNFLEKKR